MKHVVFAYGKLNDPDVRQYLGINMVRMGAATLNDFRKEELSGAYTEEEWKANTPVEHRDYEPLWCASPRKGSAILGYLWEVDDAGLKRLDQYENHPKMYTRTPVEVAGVSCWVYQRGERSRSR